MGDREWDFGLMGKNTRLSLAHNLKHYFAPSKNIAYFRDILSMCFCVTSRNSSYFMFFDHLRGKMTCRIRKNKPFSKNPVLSYRSKFSSNTGEESLSTFIQ